VINLARTIFRQFLEVVVLFFVGSICHDSVLGQFDVSATDLPQRDFAIFDATTYKNKPDLSKYGIRKIQAMSRFWGNSDDREETPNRDRVRHLTRHIKDPHGFAFIDIEQWPLNGSIHEVVMNIEKYRRVIEWIKKDVPDLKIGLYGMLPIRDYWRAIRKPDSEEYRDWQSQNDLLRSLAFSSIDMILPSLYTFYPDRVGWVRFAIANLSEARRYGSGKPVYAFLWPQYHVSNKNIGLEYLPQDYWRLQLETAYKYADGIVIWGGWDFKYNAQANWNENAPWWKATKEFCMDHGIFIE